MKRKKKYKSSSVRKRNYEQYSDGLRQTVLSKNLPLEAIFDDSIVTVVGHSEVWIENYKSLILYETDKILIQSKSHMISIEGTNLTISHYMEEHMMIKGNICRIAYL